MIYFSTNYVIDLLHSDISSVHYMKLSNIYIKGRASDYCIETFRFQFKSLKIDISCTKISL